MPPVEHVKTSSADYLKHAAERLLASGALMVTPNLIEPPATWFPSIGREVANQAVETSADLIVMTTHARAVVPRMFVGSVALDVVRWSHAPVLLIKPPETSRTVELSKGSLFHHVLVPLDFSSFSEEVLTPAIELGKVGAAQYTVLHALQLQHVLGVPVEPVPVPVSIDEHAFREAQEAAQEQLSRVADRFRVSNLQVSTSLVIEPNPAHAILQCVASAGVDLIAMTTHARGGLSNFVLGSVANQILRQAGVPVLLYRPRAE
jgi:nucleotide-binding universal stress UspA family protein